MSSWVREAIVERIRQIAEWRQEREMQDMLGLGPEAAARSRRSADGLRELAAHIQSLPESDSRIEQLWRLTFHEGQFDPGASLLNELGRFRFHDATARVEGFVDMMVELAEEDASEHGQFGGPQIPGDNPWRATWTVDLRDARDVDEDEW